MAQAFEASDLHGSALRGADRGVRQGSELRALELEAGDIDRLETAVRTRALPHCEGGFFYGHQFQDEAAAEYRETDLQFCAWARERIEEGETVIYSCWW